MNSKLKKYVLGYEDGVSKAIILVMVLVGCVVVSAFMNMSDPGSNVYTHLYYIPVSIAAVWFRKFAFVLAGILCSAHLYIEYILMSYRSYEPLVRVCILLMITLVVYFMTDSIIQLQKQLLEQISNIRQINDSLADVMGRCDSDGIIQYITPSVLRIFGYVQEEIIEKKFINYIYKEDEERLKRAFIQAEVTNTEMREECRIISKSGVLVWAEILISPILVDRVCIGTVFLCEDITDRKRNEKNFIDKIYSDELTKIHNRRYMDEVLERELESCTRNEGLLSVLMIDIDYFKHFNDTYGHPIGDKVLITLADLMSNIIRNGDYLARIGGEEFMILLPHADMIDAWEIAERLRKRIENYRFEDVGHVTISIGLLEYCNGNTKELVYTNVDKALYIAKERGRNRVSIYSNHGIVFCNMSELTWSMLLNGNHNKEVLSKRYQHFFEVLRDNAELAPDKMTKVFLNNFLLKIKHELLRYFSYEEYIVGENNQYGLDEQIIMHNEMMTDLEKLTILLNRCETVDKLLVVQFVLDIVLNHMKNRK